MKAKKMTCWAGCGSIGKVLAILLLCGWTGTQYALAQVIDEDLPADSSARAVGTDSLDFVAQPFIADINQVNAIGAWLRGESGNGGVKLKLTEHLNGRPDLNRIIHETALLLPDSGRFYYDSSFTNLLTPGDTFWLVADGYQNPGATGKSSFGLSNQLTDANAGHFRSNDGGLTWQEVPGSALAIYVAGDTCTFAVDMDPDVGFLCPEVPLEISAPSGFSAYEWSNGATSRSIVVESTGSYSVEIIRDDLCVGVGNVLVVLDQIPITGLDSTWFLCEGQTTTLPVNAIYTDYLWNDGSTDPMRVVTEPGTYILTVTGFTGCTNTDTTEVIEVPSPEVNIGGDTTLCQGEFVLLDAGSGFDSYQWSNGANSRSIIVQNDLTVYVSVVDSNDCGDISDTITIEVNPRPAVPEITRDLDFLLSTLAAGYQWFRDGQPIPGATNSGYQPETSGNYQVEINNLFNCTARSDTFFYELESAGNFIPTGFSPNGDGVNDVFYIEAIERSPNSNLQVFNRYGDVVFSVTGYQNDWSGDGPGGSPLPDGDYFYILDFGDGSAPRRGNFLLHR